MLNIQYIKIPFISAFDIDNYIESLGLGIALSGEYIEGRIALDSLTGYMTGFRTFFSGSGFWLASGQSQDMVRYLNDRYSVYPTGFYKDQELSSVFVYQNFQTISGGSTGTLISFVKSLRENYENYFSTGLYNVFTGARYQEGNNALLAITGHSYEFATGIENKGSFFGEWILTDKSLITNDSPFNGVRSYHLSQTGYITLNGTDDLNLNEYTLEFWTKPFNISDAPLTYYGKVIIDSLSSNVGFSLSYLTGYDLWHQYTTNIIYSYNALLPVPFTSNIWNHVAVVRKTGINSTGAGTDFYINGNYISGLRNTWSDFSATGTVNLQDKIIMGRDLIDASNAFFYTGLISEFRLWNYVKNSGEIVSTSGIIINPSLYTGLISYLTI